MRTDDLSTVEVAAIRALLWSAFHDDGGGFTEADWEHTIGGTHVVLDEDGAILAHASVVARVLSIAGAPLRTGYVEGVATQPERQHEGLATAVMGAVNQHVDTTFELGALSTGLPTFYERLGWLRWRGPTFVRLHDGNVIRTPEDDGGILVRPTPTTGPVDPAAPISCEWRQGDVW